MLLDDDSGEEERREKVLEEVRKAISAGRVDDGFRRLLPLLERNRLDPIVWECFSICEERLGAKGASDALFNLAVEARNAGKLQLSAELFREALDRNPDSDVAYEMFQTVNAELGRAAAGGTEILPTLDDDLLPELPPPARAAPAAMPADLAAAALAKAKALVDRGALAEAAAAYAEILRHDPTNGDAYEMSARLQARLADEKEVADLWARAEEATAFDRPGEALLLAQDILLRDPNHGGATALVADLAASGAKEPGGGDELPELELHWESEPAPPAPKPTRPASPSSPRAASPRRRPSPAPGPREPSRTAEDGPAPMVTRTPPPTPQDEEPAETEYVIHDDDRLGLYDLDEPAPTPASASAHPFLAKNPDESLAPRYGDPPAARGSSAPVTSVALSFGAATRVTAPPPQRGGSPRPDPPSTRRRSSRRLLLIPVTILAAAALAGAGSYFAVRYWSGDASARIELAAHRFDVEPGQDGLLAIDKLAGELALDLTKASYPPGDPLWKAWMAANWARGKSLFALARFPESATHFQRLADSLPPADSPPNAPADPLVPSRAEVYLLLGRAHLEAGNVDEAHRILKEAASAASDPAVAVGWIADAEWRLGRHDEALAHLQQAAQSASVEASFRVVMASRLQEVGRRDEAADMLELAITAAPYRDVAPYLDLARLYKEKKEYGKAEQILDRLGLWAPDAASGYLLLAEIRTAAGNRDGAAKAFKLAMIAEPNNSIALTEIAMDRYKAGSVDEAVALLARATAANPNDAQAFYFLGVARHKQGDLAGAVTAYQTATVLDPKNAKAWANLGAVYASRGDDERASAAFARSLELDSDQPGIRRRLRQVQP
ncbi:MAG: tetratricopeptide repeat protein [Candidatus Schekmanbacteria bacterium]|nr:tetratricopeptide repeat protein [Candidatus Schekmanbacteria bacterium]